MNLGEKISEARRIKKITQKELAERINVSDKVISKWETGKSLPDVETMLRISKELDVSISELYDCVGNTNTERMEEYNEERIWQYKKHTIISCFLVVLFPILLLLAATEWTYIDYLQHVLMFILVMSAIASLITGIAIQTVQFVRLYSYSKNKYYRSEYVRVLKKHGIMFLMCLFIPVLIFISIVIIFNLLY